MSFSVTLSPPPDHQQPQYHNTTTTTAKMTSERAISGAMNLTWEVYAEMSKGKANLLSRKHPQPRNLDHGPQAGSTTRDGAVLLLLLSASALLISLYRRHHARHVRGDTEAPQEEDDGPALPGPHIDANTRMQLGHPRMTFYDWVRASNAAAQRS